MRRETPPTAPPRRPRARRPDQQRYRAGAWPLEVSLEPERRRFMVGEPIYVTFRVTNHSETDLYLQVGGHQRNSLGRWGRYRVTVTDSNRRALPVVNPGPSFGGRSWPARLPAGGVFHRELFLPNWAVIRTPGRYRIRCERTLNLYAYGARVRRSGRRRTRDVKTSVTITVDVVKPPVGAMVRLIDELETIVLGNRYDVRAKAVRALTSIRHRHVIPSLVKASTSRHRAVHLAAIRALARFTEDAALVGLKVCAGSPKAYIRQTCAQALAASLHGGSGAVLLTLRQDPDRSVRLTVLHHLGKAPCGAKVGMIRQFLKDVDAVLVKEAKRYLAKCAPARPRRP